VQQRRQLSECGAATEVLNILVRGQSDQLMGLFFIVLCATYYGGIIAIAV
jgi:hypothetical protein